MYRKISTFLLFAFLTGTTLIAQTPNYKLGVSVKNLFMDYQSLNGGDFGNFSAYHHGFELGFQKSINQNVTVAVPLKFGVVRSADRDASFYHRKVYGADAQIQYQFYKADAKVTPYVLAGVGAVNEDEGKFNMQIPFGFGAYFKVSQNFYVNWQSEYRYALEDDRNNLHHAIGFTYLIGASEETEKMIEEEEMTKVDSDNDGLEDDIDLCPQIFGPKELKGCPDRDGDGIPDYRDDCASIAGLDIFNGCPDTDNDGVSDNDDECPNLPGSQSNKGCPDNDKDMDGIPDDQDDCPDMKGSSENNGCPKPTEVDTDGDGVVDADDSCPNTKGSVAANGCPDRDGDGISDANDKCPDAPGLRPMNGCPDSDGDGIDDSRDKCPNTKGSVDANGCPGISDSDRTILETAMRAVQFDTGKASLKTSSYPVLNQIANIMERYPNYNLIIEGHTDSQGEAETNQVLSENRAKACFEYLARKGVRTERMSYSGYGETQPIANNNSLTGRELNRRVEFNLVPK